MANEEEGTRDIKAEVFEAMQSGFEIEEEGRSEADLFEEGVNAVADDNGGVLSESVHNMSFLISYAKFLVQGLRDFVIGEDLLFHLRLPPLLEDLLEDLLKVLLHRAQQWVEDAFGGDQHRVEPLDLVEQDDHLVDVDQGVCQFHFLFGEAGPFIGDVCHGIELPDELGQSLSWGGAETGGEGLFFFRFLFFGLYWSELEVDDQVVLKLEGDLLEFCGEFLIRYAKTHWMREVLGENLVDR